MKDCTNCLRRQAEEAMRNRKREMVRVNINPDSVIGEEIMYQTALLEDIQRRLDDRERALDLVQRDLAGAKNELDTLRTLLTKGECKLTAHGPVIRLYRTENPAEDA